MVDQAILQFAVNNGVGVFFGCLMFYMANTTIKEVKEALIALRIAIETEKIRT